VRHYNTLQQPG